MGLVACGFSGFDRDGRPIGIFENISVGTQALLDLAQEGLG
jgi:hypothetical protein